MEKLSVITLFNDYTNFSKLLIHNFNNIQYPKELIEWIIVDDSKEYNGGLFPIEDNIIYIHFKEDEIKKYLEDCFKKFDVSKNEKTFENDKEESNYNYLMKVMRLPSGFKRDYAVGISSNPYILHLNYDCIYLQNDIKKKINILKKQTIDCLYSNYMITYNIRNRRFGKLDDYKSEACLFHTRDFWKSKGFKWNDMYNEANDFYYGHGNSRLHYKESIILLVTNHNYNTYNIECNSATHSNYKHLELPDIVHEINNKKYALQVELGDLLFNKNINIVCINCDNVIDQNLINNNIEYLEYNKNTTNGTKIMNDLKKIPKIDMLIINLTKSLKNIIDNLQPEYIALINKKNEYFEGYDFFNNIYIKSNKKED
jgi:hypothetical protein